ncbi:MAG: ABC transporter ATP-binding protein [Candidatus Heimdallarchaeota archaeon]|nr:ABC transporter ATP-binding protein [Candidatus Heimdallarchaeota archaeon]
MTNTEDNVIIKLDKISKSFGEIQALNKISLEIREGEILALLGENGSGKSTLMKIISGLVKPTEGNISIDTNFFTGNGEKELQEIIMKNPRFSMKLGIGMVYQHFQLIDIFSVSENITFGEEYSNYGIIDAEKSRDEVRKLSEKFAMEIDPDALIEDLPVGLKQRVEILKQLYRNAKLLILDEPTAVLTPTEVKDLFVTIRELKAAGTSIIFISHKLHEPLEIADRIVTIRRGEIVGEVLPKNTTKEELAQMIVGRKIVTKLDRVKSEAKDMILEVKDFSVTDTHGVEHISKASFDVYTSRILGVAGVHGNGQSELIEGIMGLRSGVDGTINLVLKDGDQVNLINKSTLDIYKLDIAFIPEDRTTQGLISDFPITENVWLGFYNLRNKARDYVKKEDKPHMPQAPLNKLLVPVHLMKRLTKKIINTLDVRAENEKVKISQLSGGNQQKVVIGREFAKNPRLLIASEPTRGVDIGVMENVHEKLIELRNDGVGVILVSSDLDEILKLSDDIMIMYEGQIVSYRPIEDYTINEISQLMTSGTVTDGEAKT